MTISVKHKDVTGRPVAVSDWRDEHVITGSPNMVLGTNEAGELIEMSRGEFRGPQGDFTAQSDLAGLKGQANGLNKGAFLSQAARAGLFSYDPTVPIPLHQSDNAQAIYVAPTPGAVGAWVRQFERSVNLKWFGAVADCTTIGTGTDNTAAINNAIAMCQRLGASTLFIPRGKYRVTSRISVYEGLNIEGEGWFQNPGIYTGVSFSPNPVRAYDGTVLVFDPNVAGFIYYSQTDNPDANAAATSLATGITSPEYKYKSAAGSCIRGLMLLSSIGTNPAAHGLEIRTVVCGDDIRIEGFSGNGLQIDASGHTNTTPYGVADMCHFTRIVARANGGHGVRIRGNDANVIKFDTLDSAVNGGCGYLDDGQLGNNYSNCHSATNNQSHPSTNPGWNAELRAAVLADWAGLSDQYAGTFVTTSEVGAHTFLGCYIEGGTGYKAHIVTPSIIVGGNLANKANLTATSTAQIMGGNSLENINTIRPISGNPFYVDASDLRLEKDTGNVTLNIKPVGGTYSNLKMWSGNTMSSGLDILVGGTVAYLSCNEFYFRNAAQSQTFMALSNSGLDIVSGTPQLKVSGTKVVGPRQTGTVADATDLATAIALVNDLKAKLVAHGLIS